MLDSALRYSRTLLTNTLLPGIFNQVSLFIQGHETMFCITTRYSYSRSNF